MMSASQGKELSVRRRILVVVVLVLATVAAYANTLHVPWLLDDPTAIANNPSLRHLSQLGAVLSPPDTSTTGGRPLLNLSFAVNYAFGGTSVTGYHAVNLLIHVLAGLTLLGVVRRTLDLAPLRRAPGSARPASTEHWLFAAVVVGVWLLHPLQTEAVTYVSERAESLMALFYLLTVYGFVRYAGGPPAADGAAAGAVVTPATARRPRLWACASVLACACGMATKEVMVTAPVLVLLYDRTFVSPSFREALARRRGYYLALAVTWAWLAYLIVSSHLFANRAVGFNPRLSPLTYALTEFKVVAEYAKLAFWPHPLVFDYGTEIFIHRVIQAAPYVALGVAVLAAAVVAWRRSKPAGFLMTGFFLLLAPTSSVVPVVSQPMAESRMYLPLAFVVLLVAAGACRWAGRPALVVLAAVALGLGWTTRVRNHDYRSTLAIWSDTVEKQPQTWRGRCALGYALAAIPGRENEAIAEFEKVVAEVPACAEAQCALGTLLEGIPGRRPQADAAFAAALRVNPDLALAHYSLGTDLAQEGRLMEAIAHYRAALRIDPDYVEALYNLANKLAPLPGGAPEAIADYEHALRLRPDYPNAENNLAATYARLGRLDQAIAHLKRAVALDPANAMARANLADLEAARR